MGDMRTPAKRSRFSKLRVLIGLVLFVTACVVLTNAISKVEEIPTLRFEPIVIAAAIGVVAQSLFALVIMLLVRVECPDFRFLESIAVCYVPMLGKYLPGRVWTFSMSFWMYTSVGVSKAVALQMMTLTIVISLVTGMLTTLLTGFQLLTSVVSLSTSHFTGIVIFVFLSLSLSPSILKMLKMRWSHLNILEVPRPRLIGLISINVLGWGLYGVGFYFLALGVAPIAPQHLPLCIAVFPLAQLIGFISFMVPAGLGVREAVIVAGLSSIAGESEAVIIALVCRIWQTVLELAFALLGWTAFCKRIQTKI